MELKPLPSDWSVQTSNKSRFFPPSRGPGLTMVLPGRVQPTQGYVRKEKTLRHVTAPYSQSHHLRNNDRYLSPKAPGPCVSSSAINAD